MFCLSVYRWGSSSFLTKYLDSCPLSLKHKFNNNDNNATHDIGLRKESRFIFMRYWFSLYMCFIVMVMLLKSYTLVLVLSCLLWKPGVLLITHWYYSHLTMVPHCLVVLIRVRFEYLTFAVHACIAFTNEHAYLPDTSSDYLLTRGWGPKLILQMPINCMHV